MNQTVNLVVSVGPDGIKTEQVYPCRCGETHRGPYGAYDYGHHECFHDSDLVSLGPPGQVMCMDCGKSWIVVEPQRAG